MRDVFLQMYSDIESYEGGFGDGVETGPYNPFDLLEADAVPEPELLGVSVSMLCYLGTAIDNSTYEDAVASTVANRAKKICELGWCSPSPEIEGAVNAFFKSESRFMDALKVVYTHIVKPELERLTVAKGQP